MATSPLLEIGLLSAGQSNPDVAVNRYWFSTEVLATGVISQTATPPGSPSDGDAYIVGASATGEWTSKDNDLAIYAQGWYFLSPAEGLTLWNQDTDTFWQYRSLTWADAGGLGGGASTFEFTNGTISLTAGAPVIHDGTELNQLAPGTDDNGARFLGLIDQAYAASATVTIYPPGQVITYASWSWASIGAPIFWTGATTLTQTAPSSGYSKQVGTALSATQVLVVDGPAIS